MRHKINPVRQKIAKILRKYHAIPVLALATALIISGEERHRREESVFGEAFILAEVEHIVKFFSEI